jgi:hypothetical protein
MGGLECSRACLSRRTRADDPDNQEAPLDWFLLPLWPPVAAPSAPKLVAAPPEVLVRTLEALPLPQHLLHAYAQYKYDECIRYEMT